MTRDDLTRYFTYLDGLRESGITNMLGAAPYLRARFPELDEASSGLVVELWIDGYIRGGTVRIAVYGTLKRGGWNHRVIKSCVGEPVITEVPGYKLCFSDMAGSFPVAFPSRSDRIRVEVYEVTRYPGYIIGELDALENVGVAYDRVEIEPDTFMYVGIRKFWDDWSPRIKLRDCRIVDGAYEWTV